MRGVNYAEKNQNILKRTPIDAWYGKECISEVT